MVLAKDQFFNGFSKLESGMSHDKYYVDNGIFRVVKSTSDTRAKKCDNDLQLNSQMTV